MISLNESALRLTEKIIQIGCKINETFKLPVLSTESVHVDVSRSLQAAFLEFHRNEIGFLKFYFEKTPVHERRLN